MTKVKIYPSRVSGRLQAPSSKSYTHRAVVLASLAEGETRIIKPLRSRDTMASVDACRSLGASITEEREEWRVRGISNPQTPEDIIDVKNSGTTLRIATGISSLTPDGFVVLTGDESIRRRPMQPLLDSLNDLGVECWSSRRNGLPPIIVRGGSFMGGETRVKGDVSSQFITALLVATPKAQKDTVVRVFGEVVSDRYIEMTLHMLRHFEVEVECKGSREYFIPSRQAYTSKDVRVPGDFSSAALLLALGALTGSKVTVENLDFKMPQGDVKVIEILREMGGGLEVDADEGEATIHGGSLKGGFFNLKETPDLLPVVSVLGLKAEGKTVIDGVRHARFKESDRIAILAKELRKLGPMIEELEDGIAIEGSLSLKGCSMDAHGDHRLFMALCVAAASACEPCIVEGAESVDVSYPGFIQDIRNLGVGVEVVEDAG